MKTDIFAGLYICVVVSNEMEMISGFTAPSVVRCLNDPHRRALFFKNVADARQYYTALVRNGTDVLLCPRREGGGVCVCEVSPLAPDDGIAWMREKV